MLRLQQAQISEHPVQIQQAQISEHPVQIQQAQLSSQQPAPHEQEVIRQ